MLLHCKKCHHEWECIGIDDRICNWCGGGSNILESETPLEKFILSREDLIEKVKIIHILIGSLKK